MLPKPSDKQISAAHEGEKCRDCGRSIADAQYNLIVEYLEGLTPEGLSEEIETLVIDTVGDIEGPLGKIFTKGGIKRFVDEIFSLVNAYYQSRQPVDREEEVKE